MSAQPLFYSGALLLLSLGLFHCLGPYSISDLIGAQTAIRSTDLVALFVYVAVLSFIVFYSLRLMASYSKGVDDTTATKKHHRFHDQEEMSTCSEEDYEQDEVIVCCSSCGVTEDDDTHLQTCDACDLVQYCSDDCKNEHRAVHEKSCQKRAAELRDELLFKQPESTHFGDCPICLLPLSDDINGCVMESCCSMFVCIGCSHANRQRELEGGLEQKCPFCRVTPPATNEEGEVRKMKRVEANDPVALCEVGKKHYHEGDYSAAFEYWTRAIEGEGPGAVGAHAHLSTLYEKGLGGAEKDEKKELYHLEVASLAGHPTARCSLANYEGRHGNEDRAIKHLIIAVKQGSNDAIQKIHKMYAQKMIKKEGYAACLRVYQKAVEATKSPQREMAAKSVAQGLNPWDRVETTQDDEEQSSQMQRQSRANNTRSRGGKKSSKKGKGKQQQTKQHEKQKAISTTSTMCKQQPPPPKKL